MKNEELRIVECAEFILREAAGRTPAFFILNY